MPSSSRTFASDNWSGIHPDIFAALAAANTSHAPAYGNDLHTAQIKKTHAARIWRKYFDAFLCSQGRRRMSLPSRPCFSPVKMSFARRRPISIRMNTAHMNDFRACAFFSFRAKTAKSYAGCFRAAPARRRCNERQSASAGHHKRHGMWHDIHGTGNAGACRLRPSP